MKNILGQGISADGKRTMKKQHLTENQIEFLGPHAETFLNYLEEQIQKNLKNLNLTQSWTKFLKKWVSLGEARVNFVKLFHGSGSK